MSDELEAVLAATEAANPPEPDAKADEVKAEGAEEPLELTADMEADDAGEEGDESGEQPQRKRRSKPASERIAELTARLRETERQLEAAGKPEAAGDAPPAKPDPAAFEFGEADPDYQAANAEWIVENKFAERKQVESAQAEHRDMLASINTGISTAEKTAKAKYDDFDARIADAVEARGGEALPPLLTIGIGISPVGGDIIYRLATDEAASDRMEKLAKGGAATANAMAMALGELEGEYIDGDDDADLDWNDNLDMARMMGRMRSRLKGANAPKREAAAIAVTNAPEPPAQRARGGGGRTRVSPDTDDVRAFMRDYGKELGL